MQTYIDKCIEKKIPIFILSDSDLEEAKEYLDCRCLDYEIKEEKNVKVSCRHYPFTCKEADLYDIEAHRWEETDGAYGACECRGVCPCEDGITDRIYITIGDCEYMKEICNCYDDCCAYYEIFTRFTINYFPMKIPCDLED